MTTKDEQPGRDPLSGIRRMSVYGGSYYGEPTTYTEDEEDGPYVLYDDIAALIANGELMVVRTARLCSYPPFRAGEVMCSRCTSPIGNLRDGVVKRFCPGCGARIIE